MLPAPPEGIDFLNGLLLAAGGAAVTGFSPMRAFAQSPDIGSDPRARRGGNLPEVYNVGHWMRDERLTKPRALFP